MSHELDAAAKAYRDPFWTNRPRHHTRDTRAEVRASLDPPVAAHLVFANSEQPVLAGSPLAIEAIQKSAMDQRARCRRTTERHSVGGISLFGH